MATFTTTLDELMTPRLLDRVASESGLSDAKVRRGIAGALASILDSLAGQANDTRTMGRVADLVSTNGKPEAPEAGQQLLRITRDHGSLVDKLGTMLDASIRASTTVVTAAASLAVSAIRKLTHDNIDATSVAATLRNQRGDIHASVPPDLQMRDEVTPERDEYAGGRDDLRDSVVAQSRTRSVGAWWALTALAILLLALWLYNHGYLGVR